MGIFTLELGPVRKLLAETFQAGKTGKALFDTRVAGMNDVRQVFDQVYTMLVETAQASEVYREDFISYHAARHAPDSLVCALKTEFRFIGNLGLGGKFWVDVEGFRVTCDPEDRTQERILLTRKLNESLRPMFLSWYRILGGDELLA